MVLHISRLEIRNYRNFEHLVVDPFPARAVVVGENGTGKSNLLRALRLLLDPALPDTARALNAEDVWKGAAAQISSGVRVSVEIELAGFDDDEGSTSVLDRCMVRSNPYAARIAYVWEPKEHSPGSNLEVEDYAWSIYGAGDRTNDVSRVRRDIALRVLDALRDAENDLQVWRRNPIREMLARIDLDPTVKSDVASALQDAVDSLSTDAGIIRLETLLSDRLTAMAGASLNIDPALGFVTGDSDDLLRGVQLYIDRARTVGVSGASLGGSNVLYLALLLEQFAQRRAAEEYAAYVLGVEEPEAHLHVTLQRKLFRWLLREEESLILTTHSPHIAAVSPLASIVRLQIDGTGTVGRVAPIAALTRAQVDDLERYLDVSRAEILFARAVILVEGAAEQFLVPVLAEILGIDLDEWGIVVASVQGTDFDPYLRLLGPGGLATPVVVITDGDRVPGKAAEPGLVRGLRISELLGPTLSAEVGVDASVSDPDLVREMLAERGIFVGDRTLELDLRTTFGHEMATAFAHFVQSERRRESFATELYAMEENDVDLRLQSRLLARIEDIGKGRYAQRLAGTIDPTLFGQLGSDDVPKGVRHIILALKAARMLVGNGQ